MPFLAAQASNTRPTANESSPVSVRSAPLVSVSSRSQAIGGQGNNGGVDRFFVACSNAYASSINFGSLHAVPVKLTLNGAGRGSKPSGKAVGPVPIDTGTKPQGTVTVGYPGRAPIPALETPGKRSASRRFALSAASIPFVADSRMSFLRSAS